MVDRLRRAERMVAWSSPVLLLPLVSASVIFWDRFTPAVICFFLMAWSGVHWRRERVFIMGGGATVVGGALLVPGAMVIVLTTVGVFAVLAGERAVRLLRGDGGTPCSDTDALSREYLRSVGSLALEFLIGGVLAALMVLAGPMVHFPGWTVVELGLVTMALMLALTYWVLRAREDAGKA
jgi:hypothetical protein